MAKWRDYMVFEPKPEVDWGVGVPVMVITGVLTFIVTQLLVTVPHAKVLSHTTQYVFAVAKLGTYVNPVEAVVVVYEPMAVPYFQTLDIGVDVSVTVNVFPFTSIGRV